MSFGVAGLCFAGNVDEQCFLAPPYSVAYIVVPVDEKKSSFAQCVDAVGNELRDADIAFAPDDDVDTQ